MTWYFAYGPSSSPERFAEAFEAQEVQPASLANYEFSFGSFTHGEAGTSCIAPRAGSTVLGAAYLVNDETLRQIGAADTGKDFCTVTIQVKGNSEKAQTLVQKSVCQSADPQDSYLAQVREGLTYFYPVSMVDGYLRQALGRHDLFSGFLVQREKEATYNREYGCSFRRLYPWKGVVRTSSWGSAVGVLEPGEATTPHSHDEEETAMILSGDAEMTINGGKTVVREGDVIFFPPDSTHCLRNVSDTEALRVLFLWWGGQEVEQRERVRLVQTETSISDRGEAVS